MLNQLTKRGDKLLIKLLIISSICLGFSNNVRSQIKSKDTIGFKREFEKLLSKYNIKSNRYFINVTSENQSGGQTALIITNNYYGDSIQDVTNILFSISKEEDLSVLTVSPKKGSWSTPFVVTDSINANRNFWDPGFGKILKISGFTVHLDSKQFELKGYTQDGSASKRFPLRIILNPNDSGQIYVFGDLQEPTKTYIYFKGEVNWFPQLDEK